MHGGGGGLGDVANQVTCLVLHRSDSSNEGSLKGEGSADKSDPEAGLEER